MTIKTVGDEPSMIKTVGVGPARSLAWIFGSSIGPRIMLEAEGAGGADGGAGDGAGAGDGGAGDGGAGAGDNGKGAKDDKGSKLSDEAAALLKENMEKKKQIKELNDKLKSFDGIDPVKVRELLKAQDDAAKAAEEAERKRLADAGDFERLKAMMVEAHQKELADAKAAAEANRSALESALAQIQDLTVGQSFSQSEFVSKELVLTPAKARVVYGNHFDVEDGKVVAYDKPKGAAERTKLVDGQGQPLAFEAALKKLVESDPEKDALIKSKLAPGAGSKTDNAKTDPKQPEATGVSRIAQALSERKKK